MPAGTPRAGRPRADANPGPPEVHVALITAEVHVPLVTAEVHVCLQSPRRFRCPRSQRGVDRTVPAHHVAYGGFVLQSVVPAPEIPASNNILEYKAAGLGPP